MGPLWLVAPTVLSLRRPVDPDTPPRSRITDTSPGGEELAIKIAWAYSVKQRMWSGSLEKGGTEIRASITLRFSGNRWEVSHLIFR